MDDPVCAKEKSRWFQELLDVQRECSIAHNKSYVGKTLRILVDSVGKYADGYLSGRTEHNVIVDFKGDRELIGSFVSVKITDALNWALVGEKYKQFGGHYGLNQTSTRDGKNDSGF